jgi:hypothetical protein
MPVQDVRVIEMPVRREVSGDVVQLEVREGPRPAAIDAMRWGATLLMQLGLGEEGRRIGR